MLVYLKEGGARIFSVHSRESLGEDIYNGNFAACSYVVVSKRDVFAYRVSVDSRLCALDILKALHSVHSTLITMPDEDRFYLRSHYKRAANHYGLPLSNEASYICISSIGSAEGPSLLTITRESPESEELREELFSSLHIALI